MNRKLFTAAVSLSAGAAVWAIILLPFLTSCDTFNAGKIVTALTNAIPHTTTTTIPSVPAPATNAPVKPLPGSDMTIRYYPADSGGTNPCVTVTHWCSGKPGDAFEPGKGYEIPISATWSIVGTNIQCQAENGWWYAPGIDYRGLVNPITLTFVAKSGTWEYTIWQPSVSGKSILPKKIR